MRISFLSRITFSLILIFINVIFLFSYYSKNALKTYENIAVVQSKTLVTKIINQVVLDQMTNTNIEITLSEDEYFKYDANEINLLISSLSNQIVSTLEDINHSQYSSLINQELYNNYNCSGIVFEIEFNTLFGNVLFNAMGSKIPVKFNIVSDVLASSNINVEEFGINNALITLNLNLLFDFSLYLPFSSKLDQCNIDIPLSVLLIEGEVPSFMLGNHQTQGVNSYIIEVKKI